MKWASINDSVYSRKIKPVRGKGFNARGDIFKEKKSFDLSLAKPR
jgi:hypothetical protein